MKSTRQEADPDNDVPGKDRRPRREKSQTPAAIRQRLRKQHRNMHEEVKSIQMATMERYKPLDEWDLDELAHGRPRNDEGRFSGARPKWITPLIQEEIGRRLRHETLVGFDKQAASAVRVLVDFLSDDTQPQLRFKAAQLILEYVIGKPEQKVSVNANVQLQSMLAGALVLPDGNEAHPMILPGEVVEELEDADDE